MLARVWSTWDPCTLCDWKMVQLLWKIVWQFLEKLKNRITIGPSNYPSGHIPQRIESRILKRYSHTHVYSSIIHNSQSVETTRYLPTGEWINEMWSLHAKECHSALKKKAILLYATTWMKLEVIMLSEISQLQKDKYCIIPLTWGTRVVKFAETESRRVVAMGRGKGEWEVIV